MLGDARSRLFRDDADRERFLERLGERVEQYNIRLYMFVLMTNHFHFVFETPDGNCSTFMQSLLTAYTVYYNLRHGRHGHLFDGRYKAKVVEGDEYLLALSRYVHLNPAQVGGLKQRPLRERIEFLRKYRWSSYLSYIGRRKRLPCVTYGPILAEMSRKRSEQSRRYREFVETGLAETDDEFEKIVKGSPLSIGGKEFRGWVGELYQELHEKRGISEDVSFRHMGASLSPHVILEVLSSVLGVDKEDFKRRRRGSPLRALAATFLQKYAGLNQRQTADYLKAGSGAAMSKQRQRYRELLSKDRKYIRLQKQIEELLVQEKEELSKEE